MSLAAVACCFVLAEKLGQVVVAFPDHMVEATKSLPQDHVPATFVRASCPFGGVAYFSPSICKGSYHETNGRRFHDLLQRAVPRSNNRKAPCQIAGWSTRSWRIRGSQWASIPALIPLLHQAVRVFLGRSLELYPDPRFMTEQNGCGSRLNHQELALGRPFQLPRFHFRPTQPNPPANGSRSPGALAGCGLNAWPPCSRRLWAWWRMRTRG